MCEFHEYVLSKKTELNKFPLPTATLVTFADSTDLNCLFVQALMMSELLEFNGL